MQGYIEKYKTWIMREYYIYGLKNNFLIITLRYVINIRIDNNRNKLFLYIYSYICNIR